MPKQENGDYLYYRQLNDLTIQKNKFPIPIIEELIDELMEHKIFPKLDLRFRYHQIRNCPDDTYKIACRTHHGPFKCLVMPFGLINAPATFPFLMNDVFSPL